MRRFDSPGARRTSTAITLFLPILFLFSLPLSGRTLAEKLTLANKYYHQGQNALQDLQQVPEEQRTPGDYLKVIRIFRRVYRTAPTSAKNSRSLLAIATLYRSMGQRFHKQKYFLSALKAYDFLREQYPHSEYRAEALLETARIYQSDLKQQDEARKRFALLVQKHPRSPLARDARAALAMMEIGSQEPAQPATTASAVRRDQPEQRSSAAVEHPSPPVALLSPQQVRRVAERSPESKPGDWVAVTDVRRWVTPTATRIVIGLQGKVKYTVGRLSNPPRIYMDLHGTRIDQDVARRANLEDTGPLKRLRAAQNQPDVTRVVAEVDRNTKYTVFDLTNPYRLVMELTPSKQAKARAVQRASAEPNHRAADAGRANPKPAAEVVETIRPALPNRDGTRSLTRALGLKIRRIILDPGHGGHDTGTIGPTGLEEKNVVLDVALRLGKLIRERLGSQVIYTRKTDRFVSLEDRTAIANEKKADLFLSIHVNSSSSPRAEGIETYYLSMAGDPEAMEVAARENAVSQESVHQLQDLVKQIALNDKLDESRDFAADIQAALYRGLNRDGRHRRNRGVKKAPFVVLVGAKMPSVLAEIGFLSNPQEEKLLRTKRHRQKIAEALYAGIAKYVETLSSVKVAGDVNIGETMDR